jgi:hypothetical protein
MPSIAVMDKSVALTMEEEEKTVLSLKRRW